MSSAIDRAICPMRMRCPNALGRVAWGGGKVTRSRGKCEVRGWARNDIQGYLWN